ncbi:dystonin [Ornithorhynchus anatinus]|uniref:dystonin n=1 Tax=Ornithorhynchus anatinus TaxID=9258 RepID=UPI0010A83490|nr:dystonin [Ornithorhynchus anatinus]
MIAAAFLVLLRPYSIQCALFLLLLLLGTIATILFFCCWHRKLQKGRHPMKSVFSGRSRSRDAVMRSHHFRSEVIYLARTLKGYRPSPRHARRRVTARLEESQPIVEVHHQSEQETSVRKRKIKKSSRVQPEFYHSVQVTPTRKPSSGNASYRCSMSSSADFSDEDDFSQKSGSASPAPGDTLPWNLPKHERSKRKIQGGSVLDPAERAVLRIADERDKVQKKTFTKWINQHLMKVRKRVNDLYEDLRDGHNLISLLEVLSGDTLPRERDFLKTLRLVSSTEACEYEQHEDVEDEDKGPREKGRMRFHRLQNVQIALDYLKKRQVKLVNIRNDDITDGNPKLTLGLIWTIILHFQISDIHVTGESEDMSAKERLLLWTQQTTEGYAGIHCENFTTCWRDGKLFNAIIHKYRPDLIDMNTVAVQSNLANLEHAFYVAEKIGVTRLLDPEDVDVSSPDEKSVITYVSSLYDAFPKVPEGGEGINANDVEVKWVEYQNMVNYLIQWIRHHVTIISDRTFPNNPIELKALYNQYLQFKETEIPPKEIEKSKIKRLYKLLEVWIEFGRIKLLQGYHPNDIEKEWGKLIIAMLEREKLLRPEVERLEMLQQIANRVQRDSVCCEDKLTLARKALQSDSKRLDSGLQFQNEAEIAGYILECENLLRQQVIDVQILLDGKYYQADHLVQRVAKLRDEIMALRTECSSVYSKGRTLTTEQTKLMISGITQSLNSGFAQNLNPCLNSGLTQSLTPSLTPSNLTSGLTTRLTSSVTPVYTPGLIQSYSSGVDTNALQTLKLMQIRKPLLKSSLVDQNLTEEEVNMKFVQDLLNWVDEMQVQLDRCEWGSDLPSVESHLENHKNVHRAIEEFESSLKEAKISEIQMTAPLKLTYAEKLHKLESQYAKLLNTSRNQERHLDTLHNFVSRATSELIWLNEKEEEEVAYDWSERNSNISRKKEYHAELMRELDQKEDIIKSVQEIAEQLLLENHPARLTIEAYRAAMQTQWSWILQLCHCVEQHIKENSAYFEFFSDAKEATDYLKNLKDAIYRKYSCDRNSSIHKLEDLVQESMEEKEQLLQYKSTVASLVGRAKAIIQLKPRNPENPLKASIPIKAICDYRQIEITIYKDDECVLASNSHRAKWKVISPTGNEAMVPSVCFTVPPPNKEAIETANRIEQQFQNVLALWHESHINMKSVVSWHYLTHEIDAIRAGNVASIKTMLPGEHQQVLSNLQSRFEDFLEDSQESQIFSASDVTQLEREVNICKQYYQELLKSAEREEQEESVYNLYISEVRNVRLRLENCEDRLIRQIRTPLERDDLHESVFRISEQEKLKKELDRLKDDLTTITDKCEEFFSQAAALPSVPTLRSELNVVIQSMNQVYSMSSIYIDKLKTVNLVLKNTQGAEALVKLYETKLCEEEAITADKNNIENLMSTLKQWRSEVDEKREVFHALEDELQKAKTISDQMFKTHKERDLDFDWHKEKADQLAERWQNVHAQIENRLRDLESIGKSLKYYRDTYHPLDDWILHVEDTQRKIQENQPDNSKTLATQLNKQKMLVSEIEMKQNKMDECQKYSEQYSTAVKDYELQTMTYRAMVDSQQKSPVKRRRMQSSADVIVQEFMDLRTRYTALVTLMTQYIKFAGDSLKRLEEEEKSVQEEKKEHVEKAKDLLKWVSNVSKTLKGEGEKSGKKPFSKHQISSEEISAKKEQISEALQTAQLFLAKHGDKMTDEERREMEKQVKSLESCNLLFSETLKELQDSQIVRDEEVEEKVDRVIGGVLDLTTGEILSIYQSILNGLVDYDTGIRLLESQLILCGIISPELRKSFSLQEAESHKLINEQILSQLQPLSKIKEMILAASPTTLSVIDVLNKHLISESMAIRILEIQLSTGYLVIPATREHLTLKKAFQRNLVSATIFSKLLDRQNMCKDLIDPNTFEKISLTEMVQRSIFHEEIGMRLLPVRPHEGGKITLKCGRKMNILRAAHEGLISREIMFRLIGAQLVSGGLVDGDSGQKMTIEEAVQEGVIDPDTANSILIHQVQTGGIISSNPAKRLTVDEAVQCNLISSSSALLILEAQRGYVGLIWPQSGEIFPTSSSLQQRLITSELACKILDGRQKIAALYIPETSQVIGLDLAAQLGVLDENAVSILKDVIIPDKMPDVEGLEPPHKSVGRWLSSYEFQQSVLHEYTKEEFSAREEQETTWSIEQTQKIFLSYLMINSYMDANTGERLLLYDGDLEEAINMLLESGCTIFSPKAVKEEFSSVNLSGAGKALVSRATDKRRPDVMVSPNSVEESSYEEGENGGTIQNGKYTVDNEFQKMGNSLVTRDVDHPECDTLTPCETENQFNFSNLCVGMNLTQREKGKSNSLNYDEENVFNNLQEYCEQSQVDIVDYVDKYDYHSGKIPQDFLECLGKSDLTKVDHHALCVLDKAANQDNQSTNANSFEGSPSRNDLLYNEKVRSIQRNGDDISISENRSSIHQLSDKPVLPDQENSDFQHSFEFLDRKDSSIGFLKRQCEKDSLSDECTIQLKNHNENLAISQLVGSNDNDIKTLEASQLESENKWSNSQLQEDAHLLTFMDDSNIADGDGTPQPEVTAGDNDYETSLLDDYDSDSDDDDEVYDTPVLEDYDHDCHNSSLLEDDDYDGLKPEDSEELNNEWVNTHQPEDGYSGISKGDRSDLMGHGAIAESANCQEGSWTFRDCFTGVKEAGLSSGERKQLTSVIADLNDDQFLDSRSEEESTSYFEDVDTESSVTLECEENMRIPSTSLKLDDSGNREGRSEEHETQAKDSIEACQSECVQGGRNDGNGKCECVDYGQAIDKSVSWDKDRKVIAAQLGVDSIERERNVENGHSVDNMKCSCEIQSYLVGIPEDSSFLQLKGTGEKKLNHEGSILTATPNLPEYLIKSRERQLNTEQAHEDFKENKYTLQNIIENESEKIRGIDGKPFGKETPSISQEQNPTSEFDNTASVGMEGEADKPKPLVTTEPSVITKRGEEQSFGNITPQSTLPLSENISANHPILKTQNCPNHETNDLIQERHGKNILLVEEKMSIQKNHAADQKIKVEDSKEPKIILNESQGDNLDSSPESQITRNEKCIEKEKVQEAPKSNMNLENDSSIQSFAVSERSHNLESIGRNCDISANERNSAREDNASEGASENSKGCSDLFCVETEEDLDLFSHLKQCAKGMKVGDISNQNQGNPCYNQTTVEEVAPSELNLDEHILACPPSEKCINPGDNGTKIEAVILTQGTDLPQDISVNEIASSHAFTVEESNSEGIAGISQSVPESIETQISKSPHKTVNVKGENVLQVEREILVCAADIRNDNSSSISDTETTFLENNISKERISHQLLREQILPVKKMQSPDSSDVITKELKKIVKSTSKESQIFYREEEEIVSYSDTSILLQNLLKIVGITNVACNPSIKSSGSQTSDDSTASLIAEFSEIDTGDQASSFLSAPVNQSPDLLLDILKQNQKVAWAFEIRNEERVNAIAPGKMDIASKLIPLLADEHSLRFEDSFGGLTKKLCDNSQNKDGQMDRTDEFKHKADGHFPISEELPMIGKGHITESESPNHNRNFQSSHPLENICTTSESISESKEVTSGDSSLGKLPNRVQQCSQHIDKMHGYMTIMQDLKLHLDQQQPLDNSLETLKNELKKLESFELSLGTMSVILRNDMKLAEEFLKSFSRDIPNEHLQELVRSHQNLQVELSFLCDLSSRRTKHLLTVIDSEMSKLAISHEEFLSSLQKFSDWITERSKSVKDFVVDGIDSEHMKKNLEFLKNILKELASNKIQLETTAFDVQFFISEYAQDLSPNQSKQLLRLLNTTQKCFHEVQESVTSQVESIEAQLRIAQDLGDQKLVAKRQQEYKEKLQGICDLLTQTENRLIGHQEAFGGGDCKTELKHYQAKQEELQKDMQASAQAMAEIVKNTEKFLKENEEKLSQEDKALIEKKLNEAKTKCEQLNQKAEESRKELDKAVTTAIKQESEKVAAVEQLEESKNKIEDLLDWLSNMDKDAERAGKKCKQPIEQNGTHYQEGSVKSVIGEEDEVNGNLLEFQQHTESDGGEFKTSEKNLNQQYQKVKAQHEKIVSQHQAVIIATQSAQALLEKQGHYLSPEEKEKLQRNMKELKVQYETALAESERKMKLTHSLQEELEKFDTDYGEFESWLQQSEQELENLEAGADDLSGVMTKLKRQKSFSEDVISHKGDLRYITISGHRVLEAAKSCSKRDGVKGDKDTVDTSATYKEVQSKLDNATERFKSLYSKCSILGNNLKDLVDKYQHYEDASSGLLPGLQASEVAVKKHLSEPIAVDPKNLQRQLEETKALQGQVSSHQVAVEKLKKASEVLFDARGPLLPDKNEIQKTLDDVIGRYDNLSKSINERNEKLQITLTRSLSVQDGLDEMLDWMESVENSLKEQGQVPLNSAAIQDIISKNIMLEQDIAGRQSSINAMNEKVKKFMETTDPLTASSLQAKMKDLSVRFSEASNKHKEKLTNMEELKTKVELFENFSEKLQSFLETKTQVLVETDGPGKDVTELSQYMQESTNDFVEHRKDLEVLQNLLKDLSAYGLPGDKALILEKTNALSKKFKEMEDTMKEKGEAVSSCQEQMDAFRLLVESLKTWMEETLERIPAVQSSLGMDDLKKSLEATKLLQEMWNLKAPEIQKVNNRGSSLCNLISAVTSPAKARTMVKSGGAVLNGEGTASNTQEVLTNKDMTSVKKDMTDINHSYEDLGILLKDNISELEMKLSKLQKVQEESNSMIQWLQQMDKNTTSWDAPPTDNEAVRAQFEQNKTFEAELKQNVNKVQELKDKLSELLEQNPDSPEAPKWKHMLEEIDSKWKELNQLTADRQQKLEESSNNLTQFQTVEAQLKQWLVEKELMASVLGPLSIDPNMLNTQKQQVQILLNEFDTRKPQYEQLKTTGQSILNRPGEHPPLHGTVKEQLAAVAEKWDSLTGQLRDRCIRIDQAIDKSTQYQSLLRSLSDKLSVLDNKLSSSLAESAHPDAMKQQLEAAREMEQEIEQEMKNLKLAQVLCEDLSALVGEEYLKAELSRQLEGIFKMFKDIEQKAGHHVQQLQSACASSHQFQQMSQEFQVWLDTKKEEQNQSPPISAKLECLQSLIKDQKEFQKSLTSQCDSYKKIVAEGENLLLKTQGAEKADLQVQINTIKTNWDGLNKQVVERQEELKDCLEKALKYKEHVENLQPWIDKCHNNLAEIKVCIDPAGTENSIEKVKALQKEMDQHFGMVELLNNAANSLLNASEIDQEAIREGNKSLNQRVDTLTEQLQSKKQSLENMSKKLKEFQEASKETQRLLKGAKEQLEVYDSLGPQACSNKHLTIMQSQQKSLQTLKHQVEMAKKVAQELVVEASDSEGTADLLIQAESLEREHRDVSQQVEDKCSFLEAKLQGIGHFQNSIREMFSQFAEFDDELDSMAPVGREGDTLQRQREDIKDFLKKLQDLIVSNGNANKTCKMMLASEEASPDLVGIKRDLEALSKQCNKLLDRAKVREEQVESTVSRLEEFYEKLKEFSGCLQRAEENEESQGPVGMETETINQQLNIFKMFQKEEIDSLQAKQQEVNWLGQGLIQSAAKSTSTERLEHELEDVNTRWKTLNKKVAQRAAQLQEALLHCGRFQDAMESLLSWLVDTEDLVANQKPPSAEFKVVKAQIQEQKLLQRLLDDRKPTIEVIKREGEKIAETAEPADKVKILKQLSLLDSRWDALLNKAETRNRQLEAISVVAQQFHETLEPLVEWLTITEKKLANSEPIGTQTPKLQEQIAQHKALEDDIINRNKNLHQAVSIGQSLKVLSSREDKEMVQEKLDATQARYIELQDKSTSRSELLQHAHSNAQIFGEDEVELINWLNEVHDKLSKLSVQDYTTEGLKHQQTELLILKEDIMLRKQNVDQAILNGLELLKQTTGDEVVIIQDKLEDIKVRYKDITKLSSDVAKTLDQALQLAGQLQSTHESLCTWLDKMEVELLSYEAQLPKGEELSRAQERQKVCSGSQS